MLFLWNEILLGVKRTTVNLVSKNDRRRAARIQIGWRFAAVAAATWIGGARRPRGAESGPEN
jgi:hypothetical protein